MEEEKKQSVGAMWSKTSKNEKQTKYYTISLDIKTLMDDDGNIPEKINLIAFRNFYKTEDKQPDYKIYKSEKKEYNKEEEDNNKFDKWVKKDTAPKQQELEGVEDNGIPF